MDANKLEPMSYPKRICHSMPLNGTDILAEIHISSASSDLVFAPKKMIRPRGDLQHNSEDSFDWPVHDAEQLFVNALVTYEKD